MKYIHVSFLLAKPVHRRVERACENIDCFKGEWYRSAVEEKLKKTIDEQIAEMRGKDDA